MKASPEVGTAADLVGSEADVGAGVDATWRSVGGHDLDSDRETMNSGRRMGKSTGWEEGEG